MKTCLLVLFALISFYCAAALAQELDTKGASTHTESPWLATPLISSDPKMGTSIGAMAAYLFKADSQSPGSMVGAMATYSSTDSTIYGLFSRNYLGADQHRVVLGTFGGRIENDYNDFLGTGFNAQTTDKLSASFLRYSKRLPGDWFAGVQAVDMDYQINAKDKATELVLELIGLTGFSSRGVGAVVERDTRDNQNSPSSGSLLSVNNTAFSEDLGGDASFDTYQLKYSAFRAHGSGHVLAAKVSGRWTDDAPKGAYSSIELRGYTRGEYLAPHSVTMQVEERLKLHGKLGLNLFAGVACLYGDKQTCNDKENLYPAAGLGLNYMLKADEKMIVRADLAAGKYKNHGFYVQFGHAF